MAKPSWIDGRVDILLAALDEPGMSVSRAAARNSSRNACDGLRPDGISPTAARRYLTDDA